VKAGSLDSGSSPERRRLDGAYMIYKRAMFFAASIMLCIGCNVVCAEEQSQVQKDLVERMKTVRNRHEIILESALANNRLNDQDKNKVTSVLKLWNMQYSKVNTEISILSASHDEADNTFFQDLEKRLTKKVVLLEQFVDALLSIRVKLEPVRVYVSVESQRYVLTLYAVLIRDLVRELRKKEPDETFSWSNDALTTLVRQVLSSKVLGNTFGRLFNTKTSSLYKNFAFDIKNFSECKDLWECYFSFLHEYEQSGYTTAIKSSCETLLDRFNTEMYADNDPVLLSYITIITFKLCSLKNDLDLFASVQDLATKKLYNIDLFMRYKMFLKKEIYYGDEKLDSVISDFYSVSSRYFNQHPTDFVFLFQVSTLLKQLRDAHQAQTSFLSWLFGRQDTALIEMIFILSSIEREVRDVCCPSSSTTGFANIMNSSWWRSLAQASPLLVLALLRYLAPHVQGAFEGKLSGFLATQENSKQPDQDQLLSFIDKNPDLFKDVANKHPELLDLVAQRLQH